MLAELASGAAVAGLCGLAFLAYHQPKAFSRLFLPLSFLAVAAMMGIGLWNASAELALVRLSLVIGASRAAEARKIVTAVEVPPCYALLPVGFLV